MNLQQKRLSEIQTTYRTSRLDSKPVHQTTEMADVSAANVACFGSRLKFTKANKALSADLSAIGYLAFEVFFKEFLFGVKQLDGFEYRLMLVEKLLGGVISEFGRVVVNGQQLCPDVGNLIIIKKEML